MLLSADDQFTKLIRKMLQDLSAEWGFGVNRAEANGGGGLGETICRKMLLSCRNFCDLND